MVSLHLNIVPNASTTTVFRTRLFTLFGQGAVLGGRTPPPPLRRVLFNSFQKVSVAILEVKLAVSSG